MEVLLLIFSIIMCLVFGIVGYVATLCLVRNTEEWRTYNSDDQDDFLE